MTPRWLLLTTIAACSAAAPTAWAGGPPGIGGEKTMQYRAKAVRGGGVLRIAVDPNGAQLQSVTLYTRRMARCHGRHGALFNPGDGHAWGGRAAIGHDRRIVLTDHDLGRGSTSIFDLRFSPTWSRATLRFRTVYEDNYYGRCRGSIRISARRLLPPHWWRLGGWVGQTAQNLPVGFRATRVFDDPLTEYYVHGFATTVRFECPDDGTSYTRDMIERTDQHYNGILADTGRFELELTADGHEADEASDDWAVVSVVGHLSGGRATGTLGGVSTLGGHECGAPTFTFKAGSGR